VVDGVFVHVSGRQGGVGSISERVLRFDGAWSDGSAIPTARGGIAATVLDGECWVFGGEGNPDAESGVFEDVEVHDVAADSWRVEEPLPLPIHGTGAAALDGVLYVPGGADVDGFGPVDQLQILTP
jgi:N-acetylneuraminic acid mutarotase